ncbi:MAG: MATE family efflux transporter [Pelagibacteraceae bacterium]|jgi:putative MATE family efflux protein|nr:MATE family efflux transporter [Pelagibacteraceae bacterium]
MNSALSLTKDPIPSLIKKIALPASVGTLFQTLFNVVDTFFAGKISPEALSALAKSFPIYFIIIAACVGVTVGGTSLIANSIGENNKEKVLGYFANTIIYAFLISILITIIGLVFSPSLFALMGSDDEVILLSLKYTNVIFAGSIVFIMVVALNSLLHADGDTKTFRNILILSFFLNIILNPLFIFGFGFIPAMGIVGIGVATIVAQFVGLLIIFNKIIKSSRIKDISIKYFYPKVYLLKNLFFQSAPISAALLLISVGNFIIFAYIGVFGEYATAGYGSAARFEQILLLPVLGLNTAIISIIGQNFGAKNFSRVKESYFKAVMYGFTLMLISGLIIFLSADKIVSIFSNNQDVISFGTTYLKISALIFPAYPIFFISNGFFMAIKKSTYSMYLNIIRNVILFVPTIIMAKMFDGSFQTFFWSYCFFNWIYVLCLFAFVSAYIKRNLN